MTVARGYHSRGQSQRCSSLQVLSSAWLQGHVGGRIWPGRLPGGDGISSCDEAGAETPPAVPLQLLQQFLLAANSNKTSPSPRMSQSQPFRGRQCSCQHCASPRLGQSLKGRAPTTSTMTPIRVL